MKLLLEIIIIELKKKSFLLNNKYINVGLNILNNEILTLSFFYFNFHLMFILKF